MIERSGTVALVGVLLVTAGALATLFVAQAGGPTAVESAQWALGSVLALGVVGLVAATALFLIGHWLD